MLTPRLIGRAARYNPIGAALSVGSSGITSPTTRPATGAARRASLPWCDSFALTTPQPHACSWVYAAP